MKMSEAIAEVEEWLSYSTYAYEITYAELKAEGEYRVCYLEYDPTDVGEENFFTVNKDGTILNSNGDDIIDVAQEANSDNWMIINWLKEFRGKWYKKEEDHA